MSEATSMSPTAGASPDASPEPESESKSGFPNIGTEDPCQNVVQIPEDNCNQVTVRSRGREWFSAGDDNDDDDDDDDDDDVTLDSFMERGLEFKACTRCGIVGHTASLCLPTCRCGEYTHYSNACPLRKVTCFLCEGTDHVPKDCQLDAIIAKTKKEQETTVQPTRQPKTVDNSSHNPSALPPTLALLEANHRRSNITKDVHKSLLVPVLAVKVHNQRPAPRDQASRLCLNCRKPGHCFSDCPFPRATKAVRRCSQVTSTIRNTNRHLKVQPPPQQIIVKGIVKGRIVPPAIVSSLQHQRQQGRPTIVSSSNAPRIAPIQRSIGKSPLGNPMRKKIPPATAVKRIAIPSPKINAQSNVSNATSVSRN
uniref:CCHC-type domain-containing protein n=1 Tax=Oryza meridionalis TaxID=40149 RepID=A0A0E0F577_9ORYZ